MYFPDWVEKGCRTRRQRATARLKFILFTATYDLTGMRGPRVLAPIVGLDFSTIYLYIREGAFSETAAAKIVDALAIHKDKLSVPFSTVDLIAPLEITAETT